MREKSVFHPPSPETTGMPVEEGEKSTVRLRRIPPRYFRRRMSPAPAFAKMLPRLASAGRLSPSKLNTKVFS
jgi:hypothetical protein